MKISKNVSEKFQQLTKKHICKVCFKDINHISLTSLINKNDCLCFECFKKMNYKPQFSHIGKYQCLSLADYKEPLSSTLINFKENLDVELSAVFLNYYCSLLKLFYFSYNIVIIPSSSEKEKERGFSHLHEMFKCLNLPFLDVLIKESGFTQKKSNKQQREKNASSFKIENGEAIRNKKILVVDDVITTGSSLKACVKLLENFNPKKIKILLIMRDSSMDKYTDLFSKD